MTERLMTSKELSEFLAVPEATIKTWRYRGDGPPSMRLGHNTVRYRRSDVEKWLDDRMGTAS